MSLMPLLLGATPPLAMFQVGFEGSFGIEALRHPGRDCRKLIRLLAGKHDSDLHQFVRLSHGLDFRVLRTSGGVCHSRLPRVAHFPHLIWTSCHLHFLSYTCIKCSRIVLERKSRPLPMFVSVHSAIACFRTCVQRSAGVLSPCIFSSKRLAATGRIARSTAERSMPIVQIVGYVVQNMTGAATALAVWAVVDTFTFIVNPQFGDTPHYLGAIPFLAVATQIKVFNRMRRFSA